MAIEVEIWRNDIVEALYKDNGFLRRCFNADEFVLQGKVVHIPQAGTNSGSQKNRSSLPATVNKRSDSDITYALDEYTTDPVLIPNIDNLQLSYNKRQSVISNDIAGLNELVAEWVLRSWSATAAGSILRTTGAAVGATAPSGTGNRKKFVKEDLKRASVLMNKQNIPKAGRVALFPSDLLGYLQDDADLIKRDVGAELDLKNGIIMRLYGFEIMERSTTTLYTNAGTPVPKDPGASGAATDNQTVQCWHPMSVEGALGMVNTFESLNDPLYYGDIFSFLMMYGGRIRRSDAKGVVSIVEDASA